MPNANLVAAQNQLRNLVSIYNSNFDQYQQATYNETPCHIFQLNIGNFFIYHQMKKLIVTNCHTAPLIIKCIIRFYHESVILSSVNVILYMITVI